MYPRNLTATNRLYVSLYIHIGVNDICQRSGCTARRIQFVAMMHLYHIRTVSSCFTQHLRNIVCDSKEHIHADGKIGCPYHRSSAFLKVRDNLFLYVGPSGSTDDHSLEILCQKPVVLPYCRRSGEIYAYAFLCKSRVGFSHCLGPSCIIQTSVKNDLLDHPAHFSVSADK